MGPILATDPRRDTLFEAAGKAIVELIEKNIRPRDILTAQAFDNAFALDMAMGGSTNTVLHALAVAVEAGVPICLQHINEIAERVPHVCKVAPAVRIVWKMLTGRAAYPPFSRQFQASQEPSTWAVSRSRARHWVRISRMRK